MSDYYGEIFYRYRHKWLLVDSNLLLLLVVGACDPNRVGTFKRTKQFAVADYELLRKITRYFATLITTPCILTEVSNLLGQLPGELRGQFFQKFSVTIERLAEDYTQSAQLAGRDDFSRFGLTDASIIHCVKGRYLVITVDLPLLGYLPLLGVHTVNFNHIRTVNWKP